MKKILLLVVAVVVIALVALLAMRPELKPDPPLPVPNGYDDFMKAAQLVEQNPPEWQRLNGDEQLQALQKLTATNQAALDLVREGLKKECLMVPWEINATNTVHMNELAGMKRIAQAFGAASKLALIEGRTNEAALLAIDCIRYGAESGRGGVLIDALVELAIKAIGLSHLEDALSGLDVEGARSAIAALDRVGARSETYDEVIKRERQWARRGRFGNAGLFAQFIQPFLDRKSLDRARQKFIKSETDIRRMQIRLAAHAYELEHGQEPDSLADLVPKYLKAIPLDPATGQEMSLH